MARPPAVADAGPSAPDRNAMSRAQLEPSDCRLETLSLPDLWDQVSAQLLRPSDSRYGEFQRSVPICARKSSTRGFRENARGLAMVLSAGLENFEKLRALGGAGTGRAQMATAFLQRNAPGPWFPSIDSAGPRA
jgi:hypothetical protein